MASEDEFSNYSDEEITQVQYQPRISSASPRVGSSTKKGKSPRPARPGSSAKNPYASSGKPPRRSTAGSKTGSKQPKTLQQYYTETLRKTGFVFSEPRIDSFSGLSSSQSENMSFSSTSHYLRQKVGVERSGSASRARPASAGRPAGGGPAYKTPEEYYDDIIELKKQIQNLNQDNSVMKSRVRRLEEENQKKQKEIESLLDPGKSEELRRTLADSKPDTGAVIHSMKQKILRLELQLKDKETEFNKLQSDMKTTKVEEMRLQMETFYAEVQRLQRLKAADLPTSRKVETGRRGGESKESTVKLKALQETILKTNETNYKLQAENKTLKQDLEKLLDTEQRRKQAKLGDKSKKELMSTIGRLEERLAKAEETTSRLSDVESCSSKIQGKIALEGTAAQRVDALDRRETELLEELNKSRDTCRKLKEDRSNYRRKLEEKDKEIRQLKKDLEEVNTELDTFHRAPTPRQTTPRRTSVRSTRYDEKEVEKFRQKHAAKTIQTRWRSHRKEVEEVEEVEAAEMIQSYLRAHQSRSTHLRQPRSAASTGAFSDEESESLASDNNLNSIYSKQLYKANMSSSLTSKASRSRYDDDSTEVTASETEPVRKRDSGRFTSVASKKYNSLDDESDDDNDDDIIMTSSRGKGAIF